MVQSVAVVGTGAMGKGIAQVSAQAGLDVFLYDQNQIQCTKAVQDIVSQWEKLLAKGKLNSEQKSKYESKLHVVQDLNELAKVELVVEAIIERLEDKRNLFSKLEEICSATCIFATNTSSLSVTSIGAKLKDSSRFAGLHFFNPVPLMKVVEVIGGISTNESVLETLTSYVLSIGHKPIRAQDTPGFVVNHGGRAYGTEALRIVQEGIADFRTIDEVLREVCGFRMGPFELLDLTGLDVSHPVMESIFEQYYQEPRYRPSPITQLRLDGGYLGRKTAKGFYKYQDGVQVIEAKQTANKDTLNLQQGSRPVWLGHVKEFEAQIEAIKKILTASGCKVLEGKSPTPESINIVFPLGEDCTTICVREGFNPKQTIAMDLLFGSDKRITLMTNPLTNSEIATSLASVLEKSQKAVSIISDSPGFITQRVVAMVVSVACDIAQQKIASPQDIDSAITLGLGYPNGPLVWGDKIGSSVVLKVLERLYQYYGDPRYRPNPWLKRRAALGLSLLHLEHKNSHH